MKWYPMLGVNFHEIKFLKYSKFLLWYSSKTRIILLRFYSIPNKNDMQEKCKCIWAIQQTKNIFRQFAFYLVKICLWPLSIIFELFCFLSDETKRRACHKKFALISFYTQIRVTHVCDPSKKGVHEICLRQNKKMTWAR